MTLRGAHRDGGVRTREYAPCDITGIVALPMADMQGDAQDIWVVR